MCENENSFNFQLSTFGSRQKRGGFTIVELIVTSSIFILITTVAVVKNSQFNSSVSITNLAYEVALQVREAQSYGVSVKEFGVGSGNFGVGYGVYFSSGTLDSFVFFADDDGGRDYDTGGVEFIDQLSMTGGNKIKMFCVTPSSGSEVCSDAGTLTELTILFERPKPDAIILTNLPPATYSEARVIIDSSSGSTREINIKSTGQIGVTK